MVILVGSQPRGVVQYNHVTFPYKYKSPPLTNYLYLYWKGNRKKMIHHDDYDKHPSEET